MTPCQVKKNRQVHCTLNGERPIESASERFIGNRLFTLHFITFLLLLRVSFAGVTPKFFILCVFLFLCYDFGEFV